MTLKATLLNAVNTAFNAVGDVKIALTITREISGTYNPATSTITPDANQGATFTTDAVEEQFRFAQVDGITVKSGDVVVYFPFADATFEPTVNDKATYKSVEWGIQAVQNYSDLLYALHLTRG